MGVFLIISAMIKVRLSILCVSQLLFCPPLISLAFLVEEWESTVILDGSQTKYKN